MSDLPPAAARLVHRQSHSVENNNRRLRNAAGGTRMHVNLSDGTEYSPMDIGQRATVVPVRDFTIDVKHRLNEVPIELENVEDPINILGPVFEQQIPVVTSQDPVSLMAAFNKRCNFRQQGPGDDIAIKEFRDSLKLIASLGLAGFGEWDENDLDRQRWLKKFDPAKRARMEQAWADIPEATLRDIRNKTIMVKIEPLLKRDDDAWGPRAVYVGSDAHNAITGPAMMVAMERLVDLLDTDNHGVKFGPVDVKFGYKRNDTTLCEHLTRDSTLTNVLEGDYSRNDREQRSRVALLIDQWLDVLEFPDWMRRLMIDSSEEYDVYLPAAGLKATLKHQLPTGTTATTFRNSAYNLTMFAIACMQQKVTRARALILGDDLLAVTAEVMSVKEWQNCVDRFKMVLKGFAPALEGQATFLSRRLFVNCPVPCMAPKFGKAFARFNTRACKNGAITDDMYMAGKSLSYAYEFRHVPRMCDAYLARYTKHWNRLSAEQKAGVDPAEQSWNTRVAGLDDRVKILKCIENERVKISDDYLRDWMVDTYQLGLCDLDELIQTFIIRDDYEVIDHWAYDELAIDF